LLEHKSDSGFSRNEKASGCVPIQTGNEIEDGGFAASRRPENGIECSLGDSEVDPVENKQPFAAGQHILLADVL
jgi:hypothetical protein